MAIFEDCCVALDLRNVSYKEKKKMTSAILDNGGNISYVVNPKCSFVVASSLENMSSSRQRSAQKYQIPVVCLQYVWSCQEKGLLLPYTEYLLKPQDSSGLHPDFDSKDHPWLKNDDIDQEKVSDLNMYGTCLDNFRIYKDSDDDIPEYPSLLQVAKYTIFEKLESEMWSVLELQSAKSQTGHQYRIVNSIMNSSQKTVVRDKIVHTYSSEDAVEVYLVLSEELLAQGFSKTPTLPSWAENLVSRGLQQVLLEEKLNWGSVSQEVGVFLELLWSEALGSLSSILTVPVTSLSLNDVSRVEGLLLQVQKCQSDDEVKTLLDEVNSLLPLRMTEPDSQNKLVSQKLDLCQLVRDILNMTEATLGNPYPSSLGKYRALRCSIEQVPSKSPEFLSVRQLLGDLPASVQQILRVSRGAELHMFQEELGNIKTLLHSTAPSSFVGILSRGLLLPKTGVEQHGIQRTDIGNLGGGIYFSDSMSTSLKYSKPSETDGSRLLLVCEVALGRCKNLRRRDFTLTCAPEDYHSVHGVRCTQKKSSDFEDDEYVVYNTDQIRLKYVVQYMLEEDQKKDFQPLVVNAVHQTFVEYGSDFLTSDDGEGLGETKDPLKEVTAGLLDSSGKTLPLKAVHVRCKLMDLLSQVIIFQTYTNNSDVPIEAKYVFPLEETAAVCGFEAFINGKHVIGKVKEKEQARKEYKQAIQKGHGAYLMDQDAPDVFTISVGNLPPGATVLIKVTFITELVIRAGLILFSLPGSVAPWQQSAALNQRTQTTVDKVCVNELQPEGEFSLSMSIEMPYEIVDLICSHKIKIKRTDCKAVLSTLPDQTFNADGFQLSFTLSQIHMPRMWVEQHPEKDTEACMLVFYPEFETSDDYLSKVSDVVIMLDSSMSMRGESMLNARRIALKVLSSLDRSLKVNVITFGTEYKEAFPSARVLENNFEAAKDFIMTSSTVGGSTELWRPLHNLNLLPPSHGVRNVLLLSDGHVQNQPQTLQLVRANAKHTRLFTCGLSSTANRYMLRALAQAGGGAYEFFDTKTKHTWAEKVHSQVRYMMSPGCSSVAVKWQQFNFLAPPPVQAPSQLCALFHDCHTLVYGFVPHCTQATLFGNLSGQEIKTMVSTTELQKTKGTFLHKLTARAIIRDYEDGSLSSNESEHEGKKVELKSYIIELSKEFSILSQFTSFVAIEERDQDHPDTGFTDVPKIIAEEDVDILPYMGWSEDSPSSKDLAGLCDVMDLCLDGFESPEEFLSSAHCDFSTIPTIEVYPDMASSSNLSVKMRRSFKHPHRHPIKSLAANSCWSSTPAQKELEDEDIGLGLMDCLSMTQSQIETDSSTPLVFSQTHRMKCLAQIRGSSICMTDEESPLALDSDSFATDLPPPPPPPPPCPLPPCPPPPVSLCSNVYIRNLEPSDDISPEVIPPARFSTSLELHSFYQPPRLRRQTKACFMTSNIGMDHVLPQDTSPAPTIHNTRRMCRKPAWRSAQKFGTQEKHRRPEGIDWDQLFALQHQDGYWECTGMLSRFLGLDMDYFANVFLKEKGICSLGAKAHADVLRLLATMLVLQLMRVKKMAGSELFQSLLCLTDNPEPRPAHWDNMKKAVQWANWADKQYPCMCSRLEIGWSWESCTRQLLGLDSLPPHCSLTTVLQRSTGIIVM